MGGFADAWEKMIMSKIFSISNYATKVLWVGLSSADPLDTGAGVSEPGPAVNGRNVAGTKGYQRIKTMSATTRAWQVADATGVTVDNAVAMEFPTATADWGTMTHFILWSGNTAGASVLAHGQLTASKSVDNGDTARFAIGELDICLK